MPMDHIDDGFAVMGMGYQSYPDEVTPMYGYTHYDHKRLGLGKEGHWGFPNFPSRGNVGGPFLLHGVTTDYGTTDYGEYYRGGPRDAYFMGCLYADPTRYSMWNISANDSNGGSPWGPEAYSKMKPTKPDFEALNAAYELRELPSMLKQRFLDSGLSSIGSYYLGLKFGWEPLLKDVRTMVELQRTAQDRLVQLLRDNGKPVRRRIKLRELKSDPIITNGVSYSAFKPVLVTQYYVEQPKYRFTVQDTDEVWASARYRYWLPPGPGTVAWTRMMLRRIYGLRPRPINVYKAIPWSWLVDWFSNLGRCIDNLDAGVADRLAADYFYVMRKKQTIKQITATGKFRRRNGDIFSVSASSTTRAFIYSRHRGDPFGFGSNPNDLNQTQIQILGALGLSKLR